MTDRELLELAAKAAEIELYWSRSGNPEIYNEDYDSRFIWNPLTDDGDAFSLMVKTGHDVWFEGGYVYVGDSVCNREGTAHEPIGDNSEAATRRTITRAAAEIGKTMP